jgi:branched-chain amino acid transport system permease protein
MNKKYIPLAAGLILVVLLALLPFANDILPFLPPGAINNYTLHVLIIGFFYAMLASSWALLMGYAGQFSFAHMAFAGVGAYTTGLMARYFSTNAAVGIIAGTLLAGFFGLIVGALCLRLRRTYLALFTIAFAEILRLVLSAEKDYTEGPNGLPVPPLLPDGLDLGFYFFERVNVIPPYYIMFTLLLITLGLMSWLAASRFGLFLKSIREDEEAAAALGVNVVRYKIVVFVVTSMVAGLAGATRAHYVTVIAPNDMIILWMSIVITMAVLGGIESLVAAAIGGVAVFWALEYLRADFELTTVGAAIMTLGLTIAVFQLSRYGAKRLFGVEKLKGVQNAVTGIVSFVLALLVAQVLSVPVTTGIANGIYDMTGYIVPGTIDMSAWRLVFFGLVLMLTLRFYQNGLLYPLIEYFYRPGDREETVAKRDAAGQVAEAEVS